MVFLKCFDLQEASYDYMEKEGERMFLECLDQLEVANAAEVCACVKILIRIKTFKFYHEVFSIIST